MTLSECGKPGATSCKALARTPDTDNAARVPVSFVSREKDAMVLEMLRAGRYSVTASGQIVAHCWGSRGTRPRPVAQSPDSRGYMRAMLGTGARRPPQVLVYVHRVVALAFIGDPGMPLQVIHRNGDRQDNRPQNLQWADSFESMESARQLGVLEHVRGTSCWNAKLTDDQVREIRRRRKTGETVPEIMKHMRLQRRVTPWAVYAIARGDAWRHVR